MQVERLSWSELVPHIGIEEVDDELDKRTTRIFDDLRQVASVCNEDGTLIVRLKARKNEFILARDQYLRTVLHLAAGIGHTRLLKCLVHAGAPINVRDGIGQTALTISLHKNNDAASVFLIESGACVQEYYYENTVSPLAIAKLHKNDDIVEFLEKRIGDEKRVLDHVSKFFPKKISGSPVDMNVDHVNHKENFSRALNINIGDQKNT
ncbi:AChain A, Crystal Structure of Engineered Northeast Structural Genomics Consortium Target, partial [Paramuricea clavata]